MSEHLAEPPMTAVLVLEDNPLIRMGIFAALFNSSFLVIGLEAKGDIETSISERDPQIVIIGADLVDLDDPLFVLKLSTACTRPLICLTDAKGCYPELKKRVRLLKGMLPHDVSPEELLACLNAVSKGYEFVSRGVSAAKSGAGTMPAQGVPLGTITDRETEVMQLVQLGLTDREIGRRLGIATGTVISHLRAIRRKLGVRTRVEVAHRIAPEKQ